MIERVLIANRGEGARRVARTVRELGKTPVVVFTADDKDSLHVNEGEIFREVSNYGNIDEIISIARELKVDAIHPVWGFVSEDPKFPKACEDAGILFIGPKEKAMREGGDKERANKIAEKVEIPTLESTSGSSQNIRDFAIDLGLSDDERSVPVMVKVARAGGGNGNRLVRKLSDFDITIGKLEKNYRNNGDEFNLIAQRFIPDAHHVEVQLLGDEYGGLVILGTRNCSIQLRNQKVVEEAPAPFLSSAKEKELINYAKKFGDHIGYTNAGTVEFLMDKNGNIFFLEFNPRLQVEHRVTELITGRDLVRHQIEIAEGGHVPSQKDIKFSGSAIEARINTQKLYEGTLVPAGGKSEIVIFQNSEGIITDHNLHNGYEINPNYDPTQAKVAVKGKDRKDAIAALQKALKSTLIEGVSTNIEYVLKVLSSEEFIQGRHSTTFFEEMLKEIGQKKRVGKEMAAAIGASVAFALQKNQNNENTQVHRDTFDPWRYAGRLEQTRSFSRS